MIIFFNVKQENHDYRKFVKKKKDVNNYFQLNFYDQSINTQIIISKKKFYWLAGWRDWKRNWKDLKKRKSWM